MVRESSCNVQNARAILTSNNWNLALILDQLKQGDFVGILASLDVEMESPELKPL